MREAAFVKQNIDKWQSFETLLQSSKKVDADQLASMFIQLTDDLAFSRTQYPKSKTTTYLNNLTSDVHVEIYKNKKEDQNRFITFWKYELPLLFKSVHKPLFYSFLIFMIGAGIGAISVEYDDTFVRLIMGDSYVNMTLDNIEKDDPMGVYKSMDQGTMFFAITFNNIRVSFMAFALGIFLSIGSGILLFRNGIMLGAFQYFFYQKGLFLSSFLTIWIHGTLEISAIVIAGAAGIVMGNSLLFPGTFSRLISFKRGAKKGVKIIIGLIPIFIVAGFLESFITRLTEMHWSIKVGVIGFSAVFIIYYFIIYPIKLHKRGQHSNN